MGYTTATAEDRSDAVILPIDTSEVALSVVVPIHNEEENIPLLYEYLTSVMEEGPAPYRGSYEVILVDDGSSDNSFPICAALQADDTRVRVIQFRRNFGKTAALHAGFEIARGTRVVTIDADMQEDPADMFRLLAEIDAGADLVSAWREHRNDPMDKTMPSRLFNIVVARLTGVPLRDFNCGFKAYRQDVVKDLTLYGDQHRFIPVLAKQRGFRIREVPVKHRPRRFGKSKYGTKRLLNGYLDFIQVLFLTTYLRRPLRLFGTIGTVLAGLGILICFYLSVLWVLGQGPIGDRPLLILGILLLITGFQFVSTGLVGEMLRRANYHPGDEYAIKRRLDAHQ
jgi:glycosyltransferase involved in cell wall biosynthesis